MCDWVQVVDILESCFDERFDTNENASMPDSVQRKLTTILAADAEGYSRMMESDEVNVVKALRASRRIFSKLIERHRGRIANTAGDGLIAEFPSVVEAVQCAIDVQQELGGSDATLRFRIGVHLGDVIVDGDDLLGEGVNLASRLESMAEPGKVLISRQVYDQVHGKLSVGFKYLGEKRPKNYSEDVAVYSIAFGGDVERSGTAAPSVETPENSVMADPESIGLRHRITQRAKLFGGLWAVSFAVDLLDGALSFTHWLGIVLLGVIAFQASPLLKGGWFRYVDQRGLAVIGFLALVNVFSWSGYPWVLWPAGAFLAFSLFRWLRDDPGEVSENE